MATTIATSPAAAQINCFSKNAYGDPNRSRAITADAENTITSPTNTSNMVTVNSQRSTLTRFAMGSSFHHGVAETQRRNCGLLILDCCLSWFQEERDNWKLHRAVILSVAGASQRRSICAVEGSLAPLRCRRPRKEFPLQLPLGSRCSRQASLCDYFPRAASNSSPFCHPISRVRLAASQPKANPKRATAASPTKSISG